MGLARKKSAQKHQQIKAVGSTAVISTSLPSRVQVEFMFIRSDSPNVLANYMDNVQVATFNTVEELLELNCHVVVLFGDAPVSDFRLIRSKGGLDAAPLCALETTAINSPGIGAQHPHLEWSSSSRFVVNTKAAATGLVPGDLLTIAAQVGDELRPISRIYITGIAAEASKEAAS